MFTDFAWLPFLLATAAVTLSPGQDTLLVMRNACRGGHRDGWLTSLGICSGLFVHALVSAAGLSLILLSSAQLFLVLKLAGAGYLIWLGCQSLLAAFRARLIAADAAVPARVPVWTSLREGVLSNLLNPKPILFYMAFLPQFIDPNYAALPQALMMAGIHFLLGMLWLGGLTQGVNRVRAWLQQPRVARSFDSVTGLLLMGLGVKLATSN